MAYTSRFSQKPIGGSSRSAPIAALTVLFAAGGFDLTSIGNFPAAFAQTRSAAYSIHLRASIPSRCTVRDIGRILILTRDDAYGDTGPHQGTARFRVECNVPYVLETASKYSPVRPRARLIPLSATLDAVALPVAPDSPPETPVVPSMQTRCSLSDAAGRDEDCPSHTGTAANPVLPRAIAHLRIAQPDTTQSAAPRDSNLALVQRHSSIDIVTIEIGSRL